MRAGWWKTLVAVAAVVGTSFAAMPTASAVLVRPPVVQRDANNREVVGISDDGRYILTADALSARPNKRVDVMSRAAVGWTFAATNAVLTSDGSAMFFQTMDKLVPADTNGAMDVYKYVFATKAFTRIALTGLPANWEMSLKDINANGSVMAFAGSNGVVGLASVWIFDDTTNVWRRLDGVGVLARDARRQSFEIVLSASGRVAAFTTAVTAGAFGEVWGYAWSTNSVARISARADGSPLTNGGAESPSISPDGNVFSYRSNAPGIVAGFNTVRWRVYVRNRATRTTTLITEKESRGLVGRTTYVGPQLVANGTLITMLEQRATNFVGRPTAIVAPQPVVYVVANRQNVLLNKTATGANPNAESQVVFGSSIAKRIAFTSSANNFTPVVPGPGGTVRAFVSTPA